MTMARAGADGGGGRAGADAAKLDAQGTEQLLAWALPQLSDAGGGGGGDTGGAALALAALCDLALVGSAVSAAHVDRTLEVCQALLEDEATPPALLQPLLRLLAAIALHHSDSMQTRFEDIVDLLLGWALEPNISASDHVLISRCFLHFHSLWARKFHMAQGLLSKLLGDMEALASEAILKLRRLEALTACFCAVLQATWQGLQTSVEPADRAPSLVQQTGVMLQRWLACASTVAASCSVAAPTFARSPVWLAHLCQLLSTFADILGTQLAASYLPLLACIESYLALVKSKASDLILLLNTNVHLLAVQGMSLPLSALRRLMSPDGPLFHLRFHSNRTLAGRVAATYGHLLCHPQARIILVEEVKGLLRNLYSFRLKDNIELPASLREDGTPIGETELNIQQLSERQILASIKFNVRALLVHLIESTAANVRPIGPPSAREGSKRDNAASTRKYSPSSSMLIPCLRLFPELTPAHPGLQVLLLQAMRQVKLHIIDCGAILSNSQKLQRNGTELTEEDKPPNELESLSSWVLVKALHSSAPLPAKLEALDWISHSVGESSTADTSNSNGVPKFVRTSFKALVSASWDKEAVIREKVAATSLLLVERDLLQPNQLYLLASAAFQRQADTESSVRKAFGQVLAACAPAALWLQESLQPGPSSSLLGKLTYPSWPVTKDTVKPQLLVAVLNFLAQRRVPYPPNWLQRLLHSSSISHVTSTLGDTPSHVAHSLVDSGKDPPDGLLVDTIITNNSTHAAWLAIQQAAQQCVMARLRTHLGGPSATFSSLERILQDISQQCMSEQGERDCVGTANASAALLPMRLVPEFVDALERHVYNAYEGCTGLPAASQASTTFFMANRKVCEEWFGRMREAVLHAGLAVHSPSVALRAGALRLQDLRSLAAAAARAAAHPEGTAPMLARIRQDVQHVLRHVALAMYRCRDRDGLVGLQTWAAASLGGLLQDCGMSYEEGSNPYGSLGWINALALQAQGQYEQAAIHFAKLLPLTLDSLPPETVQFCIARSIEAYAALADWDSLQSWLQELQALRVQHAGKSTAAALNTSGAGADMNAILALACFDGGDAAGAWPHLGLTPQSSKELTSDPRQALLRSEQMLLQAMLRFREGSPPDPSELPTAAAMLEAQLQSSTLGGLREAEAALLQRQCLSLLEAAQCSSHQILPSSSLLLKACKVPLDRTSQDCAPWLKLRRTVQLVAPTSPLLVGLQFQLVRQARKQGNFRLAGRLLSTCPSLGPIQDEEHNYECILLKHAQGQHADATLQLWQLCSKAVFHGLGSPLVGAPTSESQIKAKALLKLAQWLQTIMMSSLPVSPFRLLQAIAIADQSGFLEAGLKWGRVTEEDEAGAQLEQLSGAALRSATSVCPDLAKAWHKQAVWCFAAAFEGQSQGGTVPGLFLASSYLQSTPKGAECQLTRDEKRQIADILMRSVVHVGDNLVQYCGDVLQTALQKSLEEGRSEQAGLNELEEQLIMAVQTLGSATSEQAGWAVKEMLHLWQGKRQRAMSFLVEALQAFLKFLAVAHQQGRSCSTSWPRSVKPLPHEASLSAMLHVLHLLLVHGTELQAVFDAGFDSLPATPWQALLPQVFARLSTHPQQIVRRQLERLLEALAKACPAAIVYPAVVEATSRGGEIAPELQRLLTLLTEREVGLVEDVRTLLAQLGSIAVLWEEQWLAVLQELQPDALRRLASLREYAARLAANQGLEIHERGRLLAVKYSTVMTPLVATLERQLAATGQAPQTAHQRWFQAHFQTSLSDAVASLKQSPRSSAGLASTWRPLDVLGLRLSRELKRNLPLGEVSTELVQLKGSCAPMPGLATPVYGDEGSQLSDKGVTVVGMEDSVVILSTKTRPKRLAFLGSDGRHYQYLLKGHEDLRLDARIMQLLAAVNGALQQSKETRSRGLSARRYSVIPIGPRVGLIQWLDGLCSLYSIYRAWQQRQQAATGILARPTDVFYTKMMAALQDKGLHRAVARKEWPHDVKKRVLLDLMKETPRHLLARELWAATQEGMQEWWAKQQRFAGSMAVMSMVGYVLGVGDRHLDNLLLDLRSGELVHIDFGVCFEKGLRLRIPEIVPFRLTQTLQVALGLTGVDGRMRASCEAAMQALRRSRNNLLMLLAVFVWDPLLDWLHPPADTETRDRTGGRGRMEEVSSSMNGYASRVRDVPVAQQADGDEGQAGGSIVGGGYGVGGSDVSSQERPSSPASSGESAGWLSVASSEAEAAEHLVGLPPPPDAGMPSALASGQPQDGRGVVSEGSNLPASEGPLHLPATLGEQGDVVFSQDVFPFVSTSSPEGEAVGIVPAASSSARPPPAAGRGGGADGAALELPQGMMGWASTERSADAVAAIRRVNEKLEGRDLDANRQADVAEQVGHLLQQARSLDNLCSMYEGWTPWI